MAQFNAGTVVVTNSSTTVRAILTFNLTNVTGAFSVPETVTWTGGGTGTTVAYDSGNKILKLYMTAGAVPALTNTLTGSSSGATGDVQSLGIATPPNYDTATPSVASGQSFKVAGSNVVYFLTSTITSTSFVLSASYQEDTENDVAYSITRDFSINRSYPKPNTGDVEALPIIADAIEKIDKDIHTFLLKKNVATFATTMNIDWTQGHFQTLSMTGNVTTMTFTAPVGFARLTLIVAQDATGSRLITWPASVSWAEALATDAADPPALGGANDVAILEFLWDGATYFGKLWWFKAL